VLPNENGAKSIQEGGFIFFGHHFHWYPFRRFNNKEQLKSGILPHPSAQSHPLSEASALDLADPMSPDHDHRSGVELAVLLQKHFTVFSVLNVAPSPKN
jgi:hypothetical protein